MGYPLANGRRLFSDVEPGAGHSIVAGPVEALEPLNSITLKMTPWLNSRSQKLSSNPQLSDWSEKLLAKGAWLAGGEVCKDGRLGNGELVGTALKLFRLWSAHPNVKQWVSSHGGQAEGSAEPAPKATIWRSYYDVLTTVLQHGLMYVPPTSGPERSQLASEIRRVESICENNLLREVKFPMANDGSPQVEAWVEQVVENWEVLCGPHWADDDFGQGGQNAVSRNVLDVSA